MYQRKLAADPSSLVLGIIALCMAILFGCCGLSFIGLALSIVGLINANKSLREYQINPSSYFQNSEQNVNVAKIINIIALVLNGLITLIFVLYLVITGSFMFSAIRQGLKANEVKEAVVFEENEDWEQTDDSDSIYIYTDSMTQSKDSLNQQ